MHLFVRGQNAHALECQGFENISLIKVNNIRFGLLILMNTNFIPSLNGQNGGVRDWFESLIIYLNFTLFT